MAKYIRAVTLILVIVFCRSLVWAQEVTTDDMNKSNNPLTPAMGLNFHDYIVSSIYGSDEIANNFLLRGATPVMWGGHPQLIRATLPYSSVPGPTGNTVNGLGDLNVFDIFLMRSGDLELGIGPYLIVPTATEDETGAGKWQIGAAGTVMAPQTWGLLGALITYQHDFAGDSDRPTQNIFTLQPFFIYNLPYAFYVRSSGIWNFNWENGDYNIPLGVGAGKVWKLENRTTINLFAEPQGAIAHEGDGSPEFQTFIGLNFQFPLQ